MTFDDFLTWNRPFRGLLRRIQTAAAGNDDLLLLGLPGTGKTALCEAIHRASPRAKRPLVRVEADASAEQLDAAIHDAAGGTLVLREPVLFPHDHRARIAKQNDARLLCTSTRSLTEVDTAASVYDALRPALRKIPFRIPSLHQRPEDLLPLFDHFASRQRRRLGRPYQGRAQDLSDALLSRPWPHNVADLIAVAEQAATLGRNPTLARADLDEPPSQPPAAASAEDILSLEDAKRAHVRLAVDLCRGNQSLAARKLGITRNTLREYLAAPGEKD